MNSETAALISRAAGQLTRAGIDNSRREAEYILARVAGITRNELLAGLSARPDSEVENCFLDKIKERAKRIPFSYIFKEAEFMGLELAVTEDTLIPRPETEILTEEAVKYLKKKRGDLHVLDIGTGSGNIALAIAKLTGARVVAADISAPALNVAAQNAARHGASGQIKFIQSDIYENLKPGWLNKFDLIISNPPYVNSREYAKIQPEVKKEPQSALVAGGNGLATVKKILRGASGFLKENGLIFMEIGYGQREDIENFIKENIKFSRLEFIKDYAKIDRILKLKI